MVISALGPLDVTTEPHLQGVFAPVVDEVDASDLSIEDELPAEIESQYCPRQEGRRVCTAPRCQRRSRS